MKKEIAIIGVPTDFGQNKRGVDMGPSAIRYASLVDVLQELDYRVMDKGNIPIPMQSTHPQNYQLKNVNEIIEVCQELTENVSEMLENGQFPIVLGGDHSIAIGTVSGVARHYDNLGVIWFDAHGDSNTPDTTPSGNIHGMSLAVLLGYGDERLTRISAKVNLENVVIIGARSLDTGEQQFIKEKGIKVYTMHEIDRLGMCRVIEESLQYLSHCDGIHLSLDLDGLDPSDAPGVGTQVEGGITYREGHLAMEMLAESKKIVSLEIVEVNPILDVYNKTAIAAVKLTTSLLGKRII